MKKLLRISLAIISILMACAAPGQAERGHGGVVARGGSVGHYYGGGGHYRGGGWGGGPVWGASWGLGLWEVGYPYYGYPYYGYPYYPYYNAAPVIVEQPPAEVYVEPDTQQAAPSQPVETIYWYFCQNPQGYYPYVKECPDGWMKVVPSAPQPQK